MLLSKICASIFLLSILVSINGQSGSGSGDCNPCLEVECPRYLNADCTAVLCEAVFTWRDNDVTDRCAVTTCETRECPSNRDCVEAVRPARCPENNSKCRQFIISRCELRPPSHPLSCDDIECGVGMTCQRRDRPAGFRPVLRCVPQKTNLLLPDDDWTIVTQKFNELA